MKKYLSFFRIRFTNGLQYRAAAYAGVVTQFAWGIMSIFMFRAFYKSNPAAFPMTFPQLSSYIWLQQACIALFSSWMLDTEIFSTITSGNIAYELVRPMNLYNMWFTKNVARRVSYALLRAVPILIVAALLPHPYGIMLPSAGALIPFILSMILSLSVVVSFTMLVYIAAFFTISPLGARVISISLVDFLSGGLVPLAFFPEAARRIVLLLPFASMQNMPLQIYSGIVTGNDVINGILLQLFWVVALTTLGHLLMKKALSKVVVQGG